MKNIILILICFITCCSCDLSSKTPTNEKDKINSTINIQDFKKLSNKVEKLNEEFINETTIIHKEIDNTSSSIQDLKQSKIEKFFWLIFILLCLDIIITTYLFFKNIRNKKQNDIISKINMLEKEISRKNKDNTIKHNQTSNNSNINIKDIQDNVFNIVNAIKQIDNRLKRIEHPDNNSKERIVKEENKSINNLNNKNEEKNRIHIVYFGNVKNNFFNDVYNSLRDEAKFKVEISGNNGTYVPVDLNRISSVDNISNAVKTTGGIQISMATGFEIVEKGKVHLENNVWKIDRPATIKLTK